MQNPACSTPLERWERIETRAHAHASATNLHEEAVHEAVAGYQAFCLQAAPQLLRCVNVFLVSNLQQPQPQTKC